MQIPTLRLQICQNINLLPEMIKRSQYIIFSVFVLINTIGLHKHVHIVVHTPICRFCEEVSGRCSVLVLMLHRVCIGIAPI